jgi:copper ion binding protein
MKKIKVKTTGMHCGGCEMNVQDFVAELEGVKKVKADFKKGEVLVEFDDSKTSLEEIKAKITQAGYKPE